MEDDSITSTDETTNKQIYERKQLQPPITILLQQKKTPDPTYTRTNRQSLSNTNSTTRGYIIKCY